MVAMVSPSGDWQPEQVDKRRVARLSSYGIVGGGARLSVEGGPFLYSLKGKGRTNLRGACIECLPLRHDA